MNFILNKVKWICSLFSRNKKEDTLKELQVVKINTYGIILNKHPSGWYDVEVLDSNDTVIGVFTLPSNIME